MPTTTVTLRRPHEKQLRFIRSGAKRKVIRAGRRGGKTTGIAIDAVQRFLDGERVLYGAPTLDQVERFWFEITQALADPIAAGIYYKNESSRVIELRGTEQRIKVKTAWNPDTLRGDYGDYVILDEFQMMDEKVWTKVVSPMMLDHDGTTTFIYTPPDAESAARSKARDPMFAARIYQKAQADDTGRWECFTFTSHDNPHLNTTALEEITQDMDDRSYRQEIMAEDIWETPGALWTQGEIDKWRVDESERPRRFELVTINLDPSKSGNPGSDGCGMVVTGLCGDGFAWTLENLTRVAPPEVWGADAVDAAVRYAEMANDVHIIAESNAGGDMIRTTLNPIAKEMGVSIHLELVPAVANKYVRALPAKARWGRGLCRMVGNMPKLEYQMCNWIDGAAWSPDAMDALVHGIRYLLLRPKVATDTYAVEWG